MGVTSYPTDITTVSSDIDLVGGAGAFEWMIREDHLGNKYRLILSTGTIANGMAVSHNSSEAIVKAPDSQFVVLGLNTTGNTVSSGDYFWCQNYGIGLAQTNNGVLVYEWVYAASGDTGLLDGIGAGSSAKFFAGWALETDYGSNPYWARIFIDPFSSRT